MQKLIEGEIIANSNCLVIEDVVTSGGSVLETSAALRSTGVCVSDAVVLLDREQGGRQNLNKESVRLTSVLTMTQLLDHLQGAGKITVETVAMVKQFLSENSVVGISEPAGARYGTAVHLSYAERAKSSANPLTKRLLEIMDKKCTNLALSADVSNSAELIEVR